MNTCGNCKHWMKQPRRTPDLSVPTMGECRESPPQMVVLPGPQPGVLSMNVMYPSVPQDFPACGQYQAQQMLAGVPVETATGKEAEELAAMGKPVFGHFPGSGLIVVEENDK